MTENAQPSGAQRLIGDFAPKLVSLTDDVLFGDIWRRPELPPRDRSLVTVAALITNGSTEQLRAHLQITKDNGFTETELKEVIWSSPRTVEASAIRSSDAREAQQVRPGVP